LLILYLFDLNRQLQKGDKGKLVKRNNNFLVKHVGDQILLMPVGSQVHYTNGFIVLNETGLYLWELLESECNIDDLKKSVAEKFDGDLTLIQKDVICFIDDLIKIGLIE